MAKRSYRKYNREQQRILAAWAADCALKVLPLFEKAHPGDQRPRQAIKACRKWVRTGVFRMADIRNASLSSHAAAREAEEKSGARFAARSAGQAVGTAHVAQHAFGASYYALKAVAAGDPDRAEIKAAKELNWQVSHIKKEFRERVRETVIIKKRKSGIFIKIHKGRGF